MEEYRLQIIGFGPAALGIFVAADRVGRLTELLNTGICIHEKISDIESWESLKYRIPSNSPALDFLSEIRTDGIFAPLLSGPLGTQLKACGTNPVCLTLIASFLKQMLQTVVKLLDTHSRCQVIWGHSIESIKYAEGFIVHSQQTPLHSQYLLLATGACAKSVTDAELQITVDAEQLLRGNADEEIARYLAEKRPVYIVGGSHSSFSAAGYLLEFFSDHFHCAAPIKILSKRRVKEMYSPSEAQQTLLKDNDLINTDTGEVNKFDGLRGVARELYRQICKGEESRIEIIYGPQADIRLTQSSPAPVYINATGYRPRLPNICTATGEQLVPDTTVGGNNVLKDSVTSMLLNDGNPVSGLYGIGLGFADLKTDGCQVGINFFHGCSAARILTGILETPDHQNRPRPVQSPNFSQPAH
ncbi:hypothetical protein [Aliamphritea hakodatensis]|uniref:hypothetical protein n=1 Tax=Aliamphritea hakodatensis TaxID=2895352 RepID=UPI0022FD5938|nr:hypothetical protein [Aliamphritea hakodatensis]